MENTDLLTNNQEGVHFGSFGNELPDWRSERGLTREEDPDDELLPETPADVVEALGFDPAKEKY